MTKPTPSSVSVGLTFASLVVNGADLGGTATFTTSNGTTFNITTNLTSKGNTLTANLTVTGTTTKMTIDGTVTSKNVDQTTALTFTSVIWPRGACYPNGGTAKLVKGAISETMTFDAMTPSTGKVKVMLGRITTTETLPAYGTCPHAATDGG